MGWMWRGEGVVGGRVGGLAGSDQRERGRGEERRFVGGAASLLMHMEPPNLYVGIVGIKQARGEQRDGSFKGKERNGKARECDGRIEHVRRQHSMVGSVQSEGRVVFVCTSDVNPESRERSLGLSEEFRNELINHFPMMEGRRNEERGGGGGGGERANTTWMDMGGQGDNKGQDRTGPPVLGYKGQKW